MEDPTNPAIQPVAEFPCPYKRSCLSREVVRIILPVILTWATLLIAACQGSFRLRDGLRGVDMSVDWSGCPAPQQPASPPAEGTP